MFVILQDIIIIYCRILCLKLIYIYTWCILLKNIVTSNPFSQYLAFAFSAASLEALRQKSWKVEAGEAITAHDGWISGQQSQKYFLHWGLFMEPSDWNSSVLRNSLEIKNQGLIAGREDFWKNWFAFVAFHFLSGAWSRDKIVLGQDLMRQSFRGRTRWNEPPSLFF